MTSGPKRNLALSLHRPPRTFSLLHLKLRSTSRNRSDRGDYKKQYLYFGSLIQLFFALARTPLLSLIMLRIGRRHKGQAMRLHDLHLSYIRTHGRCTSVKIQDTNTQRMYVVVEGCVALFLERISFVFCDRHFCAIYPLMSHKIMSLDIFNFHFGTYCTFIISCSERPSRVNEQ